MRLTVACLSLLAFAGCAANTKPTPASTFTEAANVLTVASVGLTAFGPLLDQIPNAAPLVTAAQIAAPELAQLATKLAAAQTADAAAPILTQAEDDINAVLAAAQAPAVMAALPKNVLQTIAAIQADLPILEAAAAAATAAN